MPDDMLSYYGMAKAHQLPDFHGPSPAPPYFPSHHTLPVLLYDPEDSNPVLMSMSKSMNVGDLWADTGCVRGVGGDSEHGKLIGHLKKLNLKPVLGPCNEQLQFGDGHVERAVKKYYYPCFIRGRYRGTLDQAVVKVKCPMLLSKDVMKAWEVDLCMGDSLMKIKKFGVEIPFNEKGVPMVNIFEVTPEEVVQQWSYIPEQFKVTNEPPTWYSSNNPLNKKARISNLSGSGSVESWTHQASSSSTNSTMPSISDFQSGADLVAYCQQRTAYNRRQYEEPPQRFQEIWRRRDAYKAGEDDDGYCSARDASPDPSPVLKCATPGCNRNRQYEEGCEWDRCCKQCLLTDGEIHEPWCRRMGGWGWGAPAGWVETILADES